MGRRRIVEGVGGRLDDVTALDAEVLVQRVQRLLRRIGGRVGPAFTEGKLVCRTEDVEVAVAGAARQGEPRLRRTRIERWFRLGHDAGAL